VGPTIIYVPTRKETVKLAEFLSRSGVRAAGYHAKVYYFWEKKEKLCVSKLVFLILPVFRVTIPDVLLQLTEQYFGKG
jgi:hypothetical protein